MRKIYRIEVPASRLEPNIIYPETIIRGNVQEWINDALKKKKIFKRVIKGQANYYYNYSKRKIIVEEITDKEEYTFLNAKIDRLMKNKYSIIAKIYSSKPYDKINIFTERIEKSLKRKVSWSYENIELGDFDSKEEKSKKSNDFNSQHAKERMIKELIYDLGRFKEKQERERYENEPISDEHFKC